MAKKPKNDEPPADGAARETAGGLRLSAHPRARRSIGRAKGWGGLGGFGVGLLLAYRAGVPTEDAVLRAIALGTACYLLAWLGALLVWRQLARAEVVQMHARLVELSALAEAELERRRAELDAKREADRARVA